MDLPYSKIKGGVCAARGFLGSAISCGIKDPKSDRLDLSLIYSDRECLSAGMFTQNRVKAAPVRISQIHLRSKKVRAIITNSGNANACTGPDGMQDARNMTKETARHLNLAQKEVAVCSTGVIGLPMPMMRIEPHYEALVNGLEDKKGNDVAKSIITSDTHEKEFAI